MQQTLSLPAIAPHSTALFLDFDGTLADLAPQPELVRLADDLVPLLRLLFGHVGGALAIVSGRRLCDLDEFLRPLELPSAAEHGAQRRLADGQQVSIAPPDLQHAVKAAGALAMQHPRLRVEIKNAAVALHYRHAPELQLLCLQIMTQAVAASIDVELLRGKYVFEFEGWEGGLERSPALVSVPRSDGRVDLQERRVILALGMTERFEGLLAPFERHCEALRDVRSRPIGEAICETGENVFCHARAVPARFWREPFIHRADARGSSSSSRACR